MLINYIMMYNIQQDNLYYENTKKEKENMYLWNYHYVGSHIFFNILQLVIIIK